MRSLFFLSLAISAAALAQPGDQDLHDPATELSRKIAQGDDRLAYDPVTGYLPALLRALDIPVESQMAVFSKTSVQALRIEPRNPRVLFFNDSAIVGWVRGGSIEVASQDPERGMIFYLVDQSAPPAGLPPAESPFIRHQDCLRCHKTPSTGGVPGARLRSVFPTASGVPLDHAPQYDTDSRTPFDRLWGGWYVTGDSGPARHMGNLTVRDAAHPEAGLRSGPVLLDSLEGKTLPGSTLTPYSDIAALLVFQHQVRVMNLLARASLEARIALDQSHSLGAAAQQALRDLADALMFEGDAPIEGPIAGTSGFTEVFAARGPRDRQGRTLRTLSLQGRLMRYACSYMIYSPAFDALPEDAKAMVYRRIWERLTAKPAAERGAALEILRETKRGLPDYFRP